MMTQMLGAAGKEGMAGYENNKGNSDTKRRTSARETDTPANIGNLSDTLVWQQTCLADA
ncbi:MAG: hypothetical protein OHK0039_02870 [Bacteroidia bacterium]